MIGLRLVSFSRSLELLVQYPLEPWSVNDVEGLFLPGEQLQSVVLDPLHDADRFVVTHCLGSDIFDGEIHNEPQSSQLSFLVVQQVVHRFQPQLRAPKPVR